MPTSESTSSDQPTQPTEFDPVSTDSAMQVHHRLPALRTRPPTGLLAWHSTVGYMSQHYSADAQLTIRVSPRDRHLNWSASLSWGYHRETVEDRPTLAAALADLWTVVEQNIAVFQQEVDQVISPAYYDQSEWLDIPTQEIFQRLLWMTMTAFHSNWHLVILYQPVEATQRRLQMRLLAASEDSMPGRTLHYDVVIGTWGATLIDACRALYRNAAPHFLAQTTRTHEMYAIKTEDSGEHPASVIPKTSEIPQASEMGETSETSETTESSSVHQDPSPELSAEDETQDADTDLDQTKPFTPTY